MAIKSLVIGAIIASAALCGCGRGTVSSQAELFAWMQDHGLVDTLVLGGLHLECAVRTKNITQAESAADLSTLPFQVTLTITQHHPKAGGDVIFNGVESVDDFSVRIRDLALRFHEQVSLTQGSRQLRCAGAEMDYDIGLTRRKRILLTFPLTMKEAASGDAAIHIADMIIQPLAADFELSTSNISSLPTVQP